MSSLTRSCHDTLTADGERVFSPSDPALRGPQVAIVDDDPGGLSEFLAARRIVTSPRGDILRLSFHYYSNEEDVTTVCAAIREYRAARRPVGTRGARGG